MATWTAVGALLAALAVVAGASGAHALAGRLDARALALWETAARYLGGPRWLGAVTPVGGTLLIAGFLLFAWGALRG